MIKIQTNQPNTLKNIIQTLEPITTEITLQITPTQLTIKALSKNHATYTHLTLNHEYFDEYKVDKQTTLYYKTKELKKAFSKINNKDTLTITTNKNNIILTTNNKTTKQYEVKQEKNPQDTPELQINKENQIELPTNLLNNIIKGIKVSDDYIQITINKDEIILQSTGKTMNTTTYIQHANQIKKETTALYDIKYLNNFLKASKLATTVSIGINENNSLTWTYYINNQTKNATIKNNNGEITFILAQRIQP